MSASAPDPAERAVVFLMGPTAAGKTDAALLLARNHPVSLVSVDSAMVFRGMDIGTGKPPPEVLAESPHALIDIRSPEERYSAAEFAADAAREIDAIHAAGRHAVLVGGTGLYFRALERGLADMPSADPGVRATLAARAARDGWPALHADLARVDPVSAARIEPADAQRVQRALEVFELAGEPMSALLARDAPHAGRYRPHRIILEPADRSSLHRRIAGRFDAMLDLGLVDEVRGLRRRHRLNPDLPAMRAVGYRQVWRYLDGEWDFDTARSRAIAATRQLAKRQLTWLRREADAIRIDSETSDAAARVDALLAPLLAP